MKIQVGAIRAQYSGSPYHRLSDLEVHDEMDMSDLNEVFDNINGPNVIPNECCSLHEIVEQVRNGEVVTEFGEYAEGVLVYAPEGTSADAMELAAYRYYHEQ